MRLTVRGAALLVAAVVLFVAGMLLGLPLLRALAGVAVGALVVAVIPAAGRLRPDIRRELHPDRVQRGTPAIARLIVGNTSGGRQPAFTAVDRIGGEVREIPVRALPAGGSTWQVYELPTGRRGLIEVGPLVVERSDLLGLARSRSEVGQPVTLRVYPRRHAVRLAGAGRSRHHHEGEPPPVPVAGSMDLRALREYVVGDEPRHLHWKATARTGQLMVREYVDPAQPWCVVLLDDRADALTATAFEEAVEVAASILWESCEQERPARLVLASGPAVETAGGASGARQLLDRLCEARQVDETPERSPDLGRPEGWFAHVGGALPAPMAAAARRFGTAVAFDLSGGTEPSGVTTVRATEAVAALRSWNALVSR